MKRHPRDPLLIELIAAIGAGRIEIGPIHDGRDREFVHGLARPDGSVRINPCIDACDSALHEVLHRMRPNWTERAVRSKVTRLLRSMSMPELDKLYEVILSTARVRKKAETL